VTDLLSAYAHGKHIQPETLIRRQVAGYLRAAGWYVIRIQQGPLCEKGICDLIVVRKGRVCFPEIKTPTGRLSDWQRAFGQSILNAGGEYHILRSFEDAVRMSGESLEDYRREA